MKMSEADRAFYECPDPPYPAPPPWDSLHPTSTPVVTNYDRVISMTPEELAEWIWTSVAWQIANYRHDGQVQTNGGWLEWLKQEVDG